MKKISYILSFALLISALTILNSCELTDVANDVIDNTTDDEDDDYSSGTVSEFTLSMNYKSTSLTTNSAVSIKNESLVTPQSSSADILAGWQSEYHYFLSSPNGSEIAQCYEANNVISYGSKVNSRVTKLQKLSGASFSSYDADKLKSLTVSDNTTLGCVYDLSAGDVVAFKTQDGKVGVMTISSLSKVTKNLTVKFKVYYPSSSY